MSYSKIYLHCTFCTKSREYTLNPENDFRLQKYIVSILQDTTHQCKVLAINNVRDHVHILFELNPKISVSKIIQDVKGLSSKFINDNHLCYKKFERGKGYGCFSYAKSEIPNVINYIKKQKEHHNQISYKEEYIGLLNKFNIDYDEKYI